MPQEDYKYSEEQCLRADLLNQRRKCNQDHVVPLLSLMGLPTGAVITKEFCDKDDCDYWEITVGEKTIRGVNIVSMLSNIQRDTF